MLYLLSAKSDITAGVIRREARAKSIKSLKVILSKSLQGVTSRPDLQEIKQVLGAMRFGPLVAHNSNGKWDIKKIR